MEETEKKRKGGRPKKAVKRNIRASVRFTSMEYRMIQKYAKTSGMTISEYLSSKALNHRVTAKASPDEVKIGFQLSGMANNLNQLTKAVHQGKALHSEVLKAVIGINQLLDKL